MSWSRQRIDVGIAFFCSTPLACAVFTRKIRKRTPVLLRVAVGRHTLMPCLEKGFEAGQTLGY